MPCNILRCQDLSRSLEVRSKITGRSYSSINIKSHEIQCKIRNYIYLLTCKSCSIQFVGESITAVNLRMNIHGKGKSGCEHSINHYKNVCKCASFFIHILEKIEEDGFINGQRGFAVKKVRLQREDYWMKKLHTIYSHSLIDRAESCNVKQPTDKLFPPLPRFSNRSENLEKRPVNDPTKFDTTDTSLIPIAIFPPKSRSENFRRILEGMKINDQRKLV